MAAINTVPKSIHLPLTSLSAPRVLMCSASVGTESSVTLQLRDGNARASVSTNVDALELASSRPEATPTATATETAATTNPTKTKTSATVATPSSSSVTVLEASSASASVLENALTIGYPDPDMLADVLGTIQTASLKNKLGNSNNSNNSNNNNNNDSCKKSSNKNTANRNSAPTILNTNSGAYLNNPNKITITRRSSSNKINVQTVSAATNTTISSISGSKTNYIKNCLIRSSSCSNTATNVTTLAQIMSNSSTSSAASLLSQHNNNSNCSNSSNFSNASSVGSSISVGSVSSSTSTNSNSNSNSNDSSSGHSGHSSSFKSNSRNVPGIVTAAASTNTTATGIGIVTVDTAPRKSRPKLSSPTRHGPQQCQICSKIFGNASALAKHKLTHSDERKYICSLCSKAFKRQDHLNGHMMTHRNKKPYECKADGCGKSYCDARSLRRHSENHHGGVTAQANNTLSATSAGAICSGQMSGQISSSSGSSSSCSSTASSNGNAVTSSLSLSPATASGDASSPDGATCIRTYISTGSTVVDAATGIALSDEQIKAMNLPIKTGVTLLSPTTSVSSNVSSTASSSGCSSAGSNNNVSVNISGSGSVSASVSGKTSSNTTTVAASSPTIMLSDGTMLEGEGLTREQLDLISKIMQQTKQTSAQVTVSSPTSVSSYKINTETTPIQTRPRTWNMQLLNNAQNVTVTVEDGTDLITTAGSSSASSGSPEDVKEDDLNQQIVAAINPHLLNIVKIDKPVECNLCHRKFKNIPALNGHMRLHGGYFKKDPETKRSEKKDVSGPPLQTASIGVRALIEEKIISKRKDISKGSFVVPAPPSSSSNCGGGGGLGIVGGAGSVCGVAITGASSQSNSCLRRSVSDVESFLNAKSSTNSINNANSSTTTAVLPAATTIKSSNGLSIQQIDLPQSIEIFSGGQRQPKTLSLGSGANTITITTNNVPTTTTMSALTALKGGSNLSGGVSNHADPKDSTLIELLKRGTRIAVTSKKTQFQSQTSTNMLLSNVAGTELTTIGSTVQTGRQIITNKNRTVIIPSDVHVVSTKSKVTASSSSSGASNSTNVINSSSNACSTSSISFSDGMPLSLSIAPNQDSITSLGDSSSITSRGGGVYTVTYTSDADASDLFDDGEVYNVSDTEMLLQTVDTMEILNEDEDDPQTNTNEHSDNFALLSETTDADHAGHAHQLVKLEPETGQSTQVKLTTPLPTFQQFHSKELIMQNSSQIQAIANMRGNSGTLGVLASPLHSPLAYPTPPSSHENVAQSSPFIEDAAAQFVDATHSFFGDKTDFSHVYFKTDENQSLHHAELSDNDNEKILKLKSVLEESSFDPSIKVEDLLNNTEDDAECDLHEFSETNLSFLDEDQEFLNDSRNATSPLSESFFTSGIGSAEDVKQVLREVLPDENMQLHLSSEQQGENIIDLYYLPGLGLQSQMMPNSDDPLLSSSPREFGQQRQMAFQGSSSTTVTVQAAEPLQATTMLYEQTPSDHQQQRQQQEQQRQDQQMEQILPQQAVIQSDQMQSQQQPQQQQQQSEFVLPAFNQVACHTTYLDASQPTIPMTLQPLNSLLQPLIYSNISGEKQEFNMPLNSRTGGHETVLDASLLFGCVDSDCNKPVNATDTATSLPAVVPSSVSAVSAAGNISNLQPLSNQTNSILKRRLRSNGAQDMHKLSKFHTLSPHRSKLRKPSRTHYTPAPILNPDRKGTGLYCNVRKQLGQGIFDNFDDDFGDPVGLVDFSDESKVNLGSTYQAQIPAWKPPEEFMKEPSTSCGADLMWDPNVQLDDKILMRYIDLSKSSAVPMGSHSEEMALQTLLDAKGNSAAAVLTLLQMQSSAFQMKWTAFELEQFLRGLEKHGKDFAKITSELCTKTSGECVQMYYFWKKLCVDYKVSHLKMEPVVTSNHAVEQKPYVCEIAACSASFSSKAALHGHVRIHAYGRNASHSNNHNNSNNQHATAINANNNNNNGNSNNNHSTSNSNSIHSSNPCTTQTSSINAITTTAITNTNNGMAVVSNNSNNNNSLLAGSSSLNSTLLLTAAPKTLPATKDCSNSNSNNSSNGNGTSNIAKDSEFPCKVCGKVFNKVKSRSAHMKTHRVQEAEHSTHSKQQSPSNGNLPAIIAVSAASSSVLVMASTSS